MSDQVVAVDLATINRLTALARQIGVAEEYLPKWINYVLNHDADEFAEYVRAYWVSGQAINIVTGETKGSIKPFVPADKRRKLKTDDIYYSVRPGVGIRGSLNFHGRWAFPAYQQFGHEFMRPAFRAFTAGDRVQQDVLRNIDKGMEWALNGGAAAQ